MKGVIEVLKEKQQKNKLKLALILLTIVVVAGIIISIVIYNNTAWKRNFEIEYLDYDASSDAYIYSISNLTQNTYKDVKAIIHVDNPTYGNFSFESYIGTIRQHETVEYKLYFHEAKREAEEKNIELLLASLDIEKLIWS